MIRCHLSFLLTVVLAITPTPSSTSSSTSTDKKSSFFFIKVADPQFGVVNGYSNSVEQAMTWTKEEELLKMAMTHVSRLKPAFLVLVGDMQQFYPKNQGNSNGVLANYTNDEVGRQQALDVQAVLNETLGSPPVLPVYTMQGNHDIDDAPDEATLAYFDSLWERPATDKRNFERKLVTGPRSGSYSFSHEGIYFLVLNSQLYYNASGVPLEVAAEQMEWFLSELDAIQQLDVVPRNVVVLTHIPPFGARVDEPHGWANWKVEDRMKIFDLTVLSSDLQYWPTLWLCGHFHGNARYYGPVDGTENLTSGSSERNIEVVVTNSVTYPMQWDGVPANETFSAAQWQAVGTIVDAGVAFNEYIVPDISNRLSGGPEKAGVRVVEFFDDGSYRHKWFSLNNLESVNEINDESMDGSTEVPAAWDVRQQQPDGGSHAFDRNMYKKPSVWHVGIALILYHLLLL